MTFGGGDAEVVLGDQLDDLRPQVAAFLVGPVRSAADRVDRQAVAGGGGDVAPECLLGLPEPRLLCLAHRLVGDVEVVAEVEVDGPEAVRAEEPQPLAGLGRG
jgi:hypothetical protein